MDSTRLRGPEKNGREVTKPTPQIVKQIAHEIAMYECARRPMLPEALEFLRQNDLLHDYVPSLRSYGDAAMFFHEALKGSPGLPDVRYLATRFAVLQLKQRVGLSDTLCAVLLDQQDFRESSHQKIGRWVEIAHELTQKWEARVH